MGDIKTFFNAKTIALIGASRHPQKVGHTILQNLLKSKTRVIPINPKASHILKQTTYPDIHSAPYSIDLAIIATPAKTVPLILRQLGQKQIQNAIIISSGFSETGNKNLETQIKKIATQENISIIGPNSYGIILPHLNLNATYYQGETKKGDIAFISQSGAIASAVLDQNQPLSAFISIGNSCNTDFSDFIKHFQKDKATKTIAIYMESLKETKGQKFIQTCKKSKKTIIILKAGKSTAGQKAASSHTAALASPAGVYKGILKQSKCIQVDSIPQLFQIAKLKTQFPKIKNSATIITNAGGLGVLTTDYLEKNKINLTPLKTKTIENLSKKLQPNWSRNNPLDLVGSATAKDYEIAIKQIQKTDTGFIIALLTPQQMTEPLKTAKLLAKSKLPIFACFAGGQSVETAKQFLTKNNIPTFNDSYAMCKIIGKLFD
jgi:acyl-CoA synthetase (NDP forming)